MELVNSSRRAETAAGLAGTSPRREKIPAGPDVERAVRTAAGRDRRVRRRRRSLWCSASRAGRRSRCRWRRSTSRRRACASAEPRGSVDPLPDRETVSSESKTTTWASQSSSWSRVNPRPSRRHLVLFHAEDGQGHRNVVTQASRAVRPVPHAVVHSSPRRDGPQRRPAGTETPGGER